MKAGEVAKELTCGHPFHAHCVKSWWDLALRKSGAAPSCPLCRCRQDHALERLNTADEALEEV